MVTEDSVVLVEEVSKKLVGWKLVEAFLEKWHPTEDPDEYENRAKLCGLIFQKGRLQRTVWVQEDPEGNGPGWLEISLPYKATPA